MDIIILILLLTIIALIIGFIWGVVATTRLQESKQHEVFDIDHFCIKAINTDTTKMERMDNPEETLILDTLFDNLHNPSIN